MIYIMISLGIEGTAHTFGIGIVNNDKILCNIKDMYIPKLGWGIHPSEAAEHHKILKEKILNQALEKANISMDDVDIISYSAGPGLPPCLKVTMEFAKTLGEKFNKPLVETNHCISHIEIGKLLSKAKDPIMLYVSGGNTQVIGFLSGKYRVFGETQDRAIGNTIDSFIREAGMEYPGGPVMEKLAKKSSEYIELPYSIKGMDMSFTGILTAAIRKLKENKIEDLCNSFQETCFSMLIESTERAMAYAEKKEMLLTGGVAANRRLSEMCKTMCEERGAKFYEVPMEFSGDNGAMIALGGLLSNKKINYENANFYQKWRTDEVEINYM